MRNRAFLKVVLLGLLTFALVPGLAGAASQGQDLTGMLSSSAAERATAASGPIISFDTSFHDFGRVTAPTVAGFDFTVTNIGDADLSLTGFSESNPGAGFVVTLPAGPIGAGLSGVVHVAYSVASSGIHSDNIAISSN